MGLNELCLAVALLLAFAFGKNSMGSMFGTAIGTGMLRLKTAAWVGGFCLMAGAVFAGYNTTANVSALSDIKSMEDAMIISISVGLVLIFMGKRGVPVSTSQGTVGAMVAWNIFNGMPNDYYLLQKMVMAWIYSPFLAAFIAFCVFRGVRWYLRKFPIPLFHRDAYTRVGLLVVGAFFSYSMGANNLGNLVAPFVGQSAFTPTQLFIMVGICAWVGLFSANMKIIRTVSSSVFPVSPVEALVVVFTGALVLFMFSSAPLRTFLHSIGFFSLPMVPVAVSGVIVGSIVGVCLAKGGYGLKYRSLFYIARSWVTVPLISALICWCILTTLILLRGV